MQFDIQEIIARWDSGEGKPYKGSLIDWAAHEARPDDIGCMCAQGQILHLYGGWDFKRLRDPDGGQAGADHETARLLNISRAHAVLLRTINDKVDGAPSVVLTDPGKVLGDQWSALLDFWWAFDQFDADQWRGVDAARDAAGAAARDAAGAAARDAAWAAAGEIQGSAILFDQSKPLFFLPMFGWQAPSDIPPRPADYGLGIVPAGAA